MSEPQPQAVTPIDIVIYLASLVSDVKTVDPWLDVVRKITVRGPEAPQQLTPQDEIALQQLRAKLEDHLIHHDPVRSFSQQTLADRVEEYFQLDSKKNRARKLRAMLLRIWAATLTAYMLPIIFLWNLPLETRFLLGFGLGFTVTVHTGIIWFYLSALRDVKPELKKAFIYICIGIACTAVSTVQFLFLTILDAWDQPVFRYGGFGGLFVISCFSILIGVGKIARLIGMKTILTEQVLVLPVTALLVAGVIVLPHASRVREEPFFDFALICMTLCIYYISASAVLVNRIRHRLNFMSKALFWFLCMNVMVAIGCVIYGSTIYFLGELTGFAQMIASTPFIISALCMLQSGYTFKRDSK